MTTDQIAHLQSATLRRATTARSRARSALRRLDQQGGTINYVTVAEAASVSRSLLYRDPELRAEINRLRNQNSKTAPRQPSGEQMTRASRDERDAALRCEVNELRRENQALRNRLAGILGEQRTSRS